MTPTTTSFAGPGSPPSVPSASPPAAPSTHGPAEPATAGAFAAVLRSMTAPASGPRDGHDDDPAEPGSDLAVPWTDDSAESGEPVAASAAVAGAAPGSRSPLADGVEVAVADEIPPGAAPNGRTADLPPPVAAGPDGGPPRPAGGPLVADPNDPGATVEPASTPGDRPSTAGEPAVAAREVPAPGGTAPAVRPPAGAGGLQEPSAPPAPAVPATATSPAVTGPSSPPETFAVPADPPDAPPAPTAPSGVAGGARPVRPVAAGWSDGVDGPAPVAPIRIALPDGANGSAPPVVIGPPGAAGSARGGAGASEGPSSPAVPPNAGSAPARSVVPDAPVRADGTIAPGEWDASTSTTTLRPTVGSAAPDGSTGTGVDAGASPVEPTPTSSASPPPSGVPWPRGNATGRGVTPVGPSAPPDRLPTQIDTTGDVNAAGAPPPPGVPSAGRTGPEGGAQPAPELDGPLADQAHGGRVVPDAPVPRADASEPRSALPPPAGPDGRPSTAAPRPPLDAAAAAAEQLRRAEVRRLAGVPQMVVEVDTELLGHVRIDASARAGDLQMQLTADDAGGRAVLGERLAELRAELRDAGLNPSRLDVASGDGQRSGRDPTPRAVASRSPAGDRPLSDEVAPGAPTLAPVVVDGRGAERVDLRL